MAKITLIGAGSVVFAKNLISDILQFPELSDSEICLMDIDPGRLKVAKVMAEKVRKIRERARGQYRFASTHAEEEATKRGAKNSKGERLDMNDALEGIGEIEGAGEPDDSALSNIIASSTAMVVLNIWSSWKFPLNDPDSSSMLFSSSCDCIFFMLLVPSKYCDVDFST